MKTLYESIDGVIFDNEFDCYSHESGLTHSNIFSVEIFDNKNNRLFFRDDNIFDDDIYERAEKVHIRTKDELEDFKWLAIDCGWSEFEEITSPGFWVRQEDDRHNGWWEKIKK